MNNLFNNLKAKMIESELSTPDEILGCSEQEIAEIETRFKMNLPATYREFLHQMGNCAGWFLEGTDVYFPQLLDCRKVAERLMKEDGAEFSLQPTWFVFLQHQGYQFMYFDSMEKDGDPPVFRYLEGDKQPKQIADSFSQWLTACVEQESELNKKVKNSRPG